MILSKKVRLYPSELQEKKLWQSVGTARFYIQLDTFKTRRKL